MTPPPLSVVVISGYLGAGKTTLINRLLGQAAGQKIMVMVNDFGAINIDADLLKSAEEDTLTLTNGCVCCTMGADLFLAMGDALDRQPRPDILVIEASGVAEPSKIAEAAKAEPDMRYGGIVTVVDALNFLRTEADMRIGAQLREQVIAADMLLISKSKNPDPALISRLAMLNTVAPLHVDAPLISALLLRQPRMPSARAAIHAEYVQWSFEGQKKMAFDDLKSKLDNPPDGAFRIKGFVNSDADTAWEVHLVGKTVDVRVCPPNPSTSLVAIGLKGIFHPENAENWWNSNGR